MCSIGSLGNFTKYANYIWNLKAKTVKVEIIYISMYI